MKNLMCFGDSNTFGYDPESGARYDFAKRWTGIISERLLPLGVHVDEEGLCGRTADLDDEFRTGRKGSDILPLLLESHSPDLVVLMLGTNDCKRKYQATPESIGRGVRKLIGQIREYNGKTRVLLISPIHLGEGVGECDGEFDENSVLLSKKLKEAYSLIAKETGCEFLAASDHALPSAADREHLNEAGHKAIAEAIYGKLVTMI